MPAKVYDLTPAQAAAVLGLHPDTLRRWADKGRVPCWTTPTGQRRFSREDLDALLPEQEPAA